MLELARQLDCEKQAVLGYRDVLFLNDEFEKFSDVYVATEDGSAGTKGKCAGCHSGKWPEGRCDLLPADQPPCCVHWKAYAEEHEIECWLS